jgi:hypothetical protein
LFFGQIKKNKKVARHFWLLGKKLCINFDKNWIGPHFGRFFSKLIWSPWWRFLYAAELTDAAIVFPSRHLLQCCQIVTYFQIENTNLGKLWTVSLMKMLEYFFAI